MPFCIYRVDNIINDRLYIGSTVRTVEKRWEEHKKQALSGERKPLYAAMNEYGFDKFSSKLLEVCSNLETMKNREFELILEFNSMQPHGYNVVGRKLNNEQIAMIKFNVFGWTVAKYAKLFRVSYPAAYHASENGPGFQYEHITRAHIIDPNKYLQEGFIELPKPKRRKSGRDVDLELLNSTDFSELDANSIAQIAQIVRRARAR